MQWITSPRYPQLIKKCVICQRRIIIFSHSFLSPLPWQCAREAEVMSSGLRFNYSLARLYKTRLFFLPLRVNACRCVLIRRRGMEKALCAAGSLAWYAHTQIAGVSCMHTFAGGGIGKSLRPLGACWAVLSLDTPSLKPSQVLSRSNIINGPPISTQSFPPQCSLSLSRQC